jgi:hypothetical protein
MIKFNTTLGAKYLNAEARELKESLQPYLKGMYCRGCKTDTVISFIDDGYGHLKPEVQACCKDFRIEIENKITFD